MTTFISRCILRLARQSHKISATDAIYIAIFSYLIIFSILNTFYADPKHSDTSQPKTYDIQNLAFTRIDCTFPISSQYQKAPRYICYLLLVFTITIRNHKWLAAGAAASVLTYSGVAAIHLLILFATNQRLHPLPEKAGCQSLPISGHAVHFDACAGIQDPDAFVILQIVYSVMLGALPMAAWSTTFRRSASRAILLMWLLLLAVSHTFWPLTNPHENFHFQICPKGHVEHLPKINFQAPPLDGIWSESFQSLVSVSQEPSPFSANGSVPGCLYSCFATRAYIGRISQNIIAYELISRDPFLKDKNRYLGGILFWWVYILLALLTFFTTEKQGYLPKWMHKRVWFLEYLHESWMSIWHLKSANEHATDMVDERQDRENDTTTANFLVVAEARQRKHSQWTILQLIQSSTQLSSVIAFGGVIVYDETTAAHDGNLLEQEPFSAVGQWGNVAVVGLVLFAAVMSRIWAANEDSEASRDVAAEENCSAEKGDELWDDGRQWNCRVGYAS